MQRRARRRVIVGVLLVVLVCFGLFTWAMLDSPFEVRFVTGAGEYMPAMRARNRGQRDLSRHIPIYPGHVFMGWMRHPHDFGNYVINTSEISQNRGGRLYAHWVPENFLARMYVDGVNVRNINIVGGQRLDTLPMEEWYFEVDPARSAFTEFLG